jgi:hypothetical protein
VNTFRYFVLLGPVFDPLFPGSDVPDPDGADGDDHQDRQHDDAHQDRHDDMNGIR